MNVNMRLLKAVDFVVDVLYVVAVVVVVVVVIVVVNVVVVALHGVTGRILFSCEMYLRLARDMYEMCLIYT